MEKQRDLLKKHQIIWVDLKRYGRDHEKELFEAVLSEEVHVNIAANDTSNVHSETWCAACKAKLHQLYRLSSVNEEYDAVVGIKKRDESVFNAQYTGFDKTLTPGQLTPQ